MGPFNHIPRTSLGRGQGRVGRMVGRPGSARRTRAATPAPVRVGTRTARAMMPGSTNRRRRRREPDRGLREDRRRLRRVDGAAVPRRRRAVHPDGHPRRRDGHEGGRHGVRGRLLCAPAEAGRGGGGPGHRRVGGDDPARGGGGAAESARLRIPPGGGRRPAARGAGRRSRRHVPAGLRPNGGTAPGFLPVLPRRLAPRRAVRRRERRHPESGQRRLEAVRPGAHVSDAAGGGRRRPVPDHQHRRPAVRAPELLSHAGDLPGRLPRGGFQRFPLDRGLAAAVRARQSVLGRFPEDGRPSSGSRRRGRRDLESGSSRRGEPALVLPARGGNGSGGRRGSAGRGFGAREWRRRS